MKPSVKRMLGFSGIIIFLIITIFIYSSLIRPEYQKINQQRGVLATKSRFFAEQSEIIAKLEEDLSAASTDIKRARDLISRALPTEIDSASIFHQLTTLARINNLATQSFGLDILPIQPLPVESLIKGRGTVRINFQLVGTYPSLKDFLNKLETNIRLIDLRGLVIKSTPGQTLNNYSLEVDTYYQTE
jgi:Tfp pilus assembly protein PilO